MKHCTAEKTFVWKEMRRDRRSGCALLEWPALLNEYSSIKILTYKVPQWVQPKKKNQKRKIIPAPGLQAQRHMVRHAAFLIRDLFSPFTVNRSAPWHPGFLGHCSRSSVSVPKHGAQEDGGQGAGLYFFFPGANNSCYTQGVGSEHGKSMKQAPEGERSRIDDQEVLLMLLTSMR